MDFLHKKQDCSVFLFEDDDFPVKTKNGSEWIDKFCKELKRKKLDDKIMWKINCRPDEIDHDQFCNDERTMDCIWFFWALMMAPIAALEG